MHKKKRISQWMSNCLQSAPKNAPRSAVTQAMIQDNTLTNAPFSLFSVQNLLPGHHSITSKDVRIYCEVPFDIEVKQNTCGIWNLISSVWVVCVSFINYMSTCLGTSFYPVRAKENHVDTDASIASFNLLTCTLDYLLPCRLNMLKEISPSGII